MTARQWWGRTPTSHSTAAATPTSRTWTRRTGCCATRITMGESWSLSTVDPSGSVIGYTSIAVDADGNPRIAYHDGTLRLAEWDGASWTLTTQDAGSTGQGTQITVDADGKTRIAYFDEDNDDLSFSLAGHQSPAVMGNSQSHPTGSSMGSGTTGLTSFDVGETHGCAVSSSSVICWGVATERSARQRGSPQSPPRTRSPSPQ